VSKGREGELGREEDIGAERGIDPELWRWDEVEVNNMRNNSSYQRS
jgi:hypothetical protein